VCSGVYRRNEVINLPVQGSAFHCLLWSVIRLHRWLNQQKMESLIVGQIHDSMLLDMVVDEFQTVLHQAQTIMTEEVRAYWPWIITPLEIEIEVGERNWYEKKEIKGINTWKPTLLNSTGDTALIR